ncbi:MAG: hypothetical protein Q9P14_14070 [candidate division KSB1 bacterium]|nr:hypothetical protein [candidate division KSB1 bacterium]
MDGLHEAEKFNIRTGVIILRYSQHSSETSLMLAELPYQKSKAKVWLRSI